MLPKFFTNFAFTKDLSTVWIIISVEKTSYLIDASRRNCKNSHYKLRGLPLNGEKEVGDLGLSVSAQISIANIRDAIESIYAFHFFSNNWMISDVRKFGIFDFQYIRKLHFSWIFAFEYIRKARLFGHSNSNSFEKPAFWLLEFWYPNTNENHLKRYSNRSFEHTKIPIQRGLYCFDSSKWTEDSQQEAAIMSMPVTWRPAETRITYRVTNLLMQLLYVDGNLT